MSSALTMPVRGDRYRGFDTPSPWRNAGLLRKARLLGPVVGPSRRSSISAPGGQGDQHPFPVADKERHVETFRPPNAAVGSKQSATRST